MVKCESKIPLSILCVLTDIEDIESIENHLHCGTDTWYPFGNRKEKLKEILEYLCNEGFFRKIKDDKKPHCIQYKSDNALKFYLHKSRSQQGSATVDKCLNVDKVVISTFKPVPVANEKLNPIPKKQYSDAWFHIVKVENLSTFDASSMLIHHLYKEEKFKDRYCFYEHQMHGKLLYKSVIPIRNEAYSQPVKILTEPKEYDPPCKGEKQQIILGDKITRCKGAYGTGYY